MCPVLGGHYTIYAEGEIGLYEQDDVDEYIDLHEAEEIVSQLKDSQPDLYERIKSLRDGVRCGHKIGRSGTVVFCRAGRYHQLMLADERGEILSRETPRILNLLKCDPETPGEALPHAYNETVMSIRDQFRREVEARRAERTHTLSLTRAQRYVMRELRLLYDRTDDDDLRQQITILEAAFRQHIVRPAVRSELNRVRNEGLTGEALLHALSQAYHIYGLDLVPPHERSAQDGNDELPRIVCSEALIE